MACATFSIRAWRSWKAEFMAATPLLSIRNLRTEFGPRGKPFAAVDGIDLQLAPGERLAVVGESGSGKTMTALSILGLVPDSGRITSGQILFEGRDLLTLSPTEMRAIFGGEISMIVQEPMSSLNPVFTVGNQIVEATTLQQGLRGREDRMSGVSGNIVQVSVDIVIN